MVDSGIGTTEVNTLLLAVDLPAVSNNTFKSAENIIGPFIEKVARQSCENALIEEREATIKNPL